jgi:hypothetical protein|tara:strand:+ start:950 stop:1195 length:246 start_codon:yes stop_codon:yes gene_type:complete
LRRNGLSKYDAPLRIQYQWGYDAFKRGGKLTKVGTKNIYLEHRSAIDPNTMQAREWQRGWNDAYYEQLEEVQSNEQARARS